MYRIKRIIFMFFNFFIRNGNFKALFLKKSNLFKYWGDNVFWYPRILPAETKKVEIHNNVVVATDVYFCTHDIGFTVLNHDPQIHFTSTNIVGGGYKWVTGDIIIKDNVFIGAKSTIRYGVTIGPNAIVAMGSVVVKDVAPNTVVGGNPAKLICSYEDYAKRLALKQKLEILYENK